MSNRRCRFLESAANLGLGIYVAGGLGLACRGSRLETIEQDLTESLVLEAVNLRLVLLLLLKILQLESEGLGRSLGGLWAAEIRHGLARGHCTACRESWTLRLVGEIRARGTHLHDLKTIVSMSHFYLDSILQCDHFGLRRLHHPKALASSYLRCSALLHATENCSEATDHL